VVWSKGYRGDVGPIKAKMIIPVETLVSSFKIPLICKHKCQTCTTDKPSPEMIFPISFHFLISHDLQLYVAVYLKSTSFSNPKVHSEFSL
jgi:hypothetical protein